MYIGQTINTIKDRVSKHFYKLRINTHPNMHLQNVYNKHGKDAFDFSIIDLASNIDELNNKEIYWISYYNSMDRSKGYNLTSGGDNKILSEETCNKIRDSKLGKSNFKIKGKKKPPRTKEHSANISKGLKGSIPWNKGITTEKQSIETKLKRSKSLRDYYTKNDSKLLGKKRSKESVIKQFETRRLNKLKKAA